MKISDRLVGVWHLESWKYEKEGGGISYPFGQDAEGLLIYTEQGVMSAILMKRERNEDSLNGYISYGGMYRADEGSVYHLVQQSLQKGWIGQTLVRNHKLSNTNKLLILTTEPIRNSKGRLVKNILRWNRYE